MGGALRLSRGLGSPYSGCHPLQTTLWGLGVCFLHLECSGYVDAAEEQAGLLPALVKLCTASLAMSIVSACRQGGAGQAAATVPSEFGPHWFLSWLHCGGTTGRAVRHRIIAAFLFPKGGDPICKEGLSGAPGRRSPHLSCSSSLRPPGYIDLPVTGWSFSQRGRLASGGHCTSKRGVDCYRRLPIARS